MRKRKKNERGGPVSKAPKYEKPLFEESEGLTFPKEVIDNFNAKKFCIQCSACHGCAG